MLIYPQDTTDSKNILASLDNGWQMPSNYYVDDSVYALEVERIFKKSWHYASLENSLKNVGDFITAEAAGVPVVIVRGEDRELKGYVNACRHRLHPVAEGAGSAHQFKCRYHGWTYSLDGSLRAAPGCQSESCFDKNELSLIPVAVGSYLGLVFFNLDATANFCEIVEEAKVFKDAEQINLQNWEFAGTYNYEIDVNWKLFVENSLECYHCDLVHRTTFSSHVKTSNTAYITQVSESLAHQFAEVNSPLSTSDKTEFFRFLYFWPTTAVSVDEYCGVIGRSIPLGPQKTRFVVDMYVRPGVDEDILKQWLDVYDQTFNEDKEVVGAQQAGYNSGLVPAGRLMPLREAAISMFQTRTTTALLQKNGRAEAPAAAAPNTRKAQNAPLPLVITSKQDVAVGISQLTLERADSGVLPRWNPGDHIELILPNGLIRQYSLCGEIDANHWQIAVLNDPVSRGGSSYVHAELQCGAEITVLGPKNNFRLPDTDDYLFIAGGVGITPILPMLKEVQRRHKNWTLLYLGRSLESMAYRAELSAFGGEKIKLWPHNQFGKIELKTCIEGLKPGTAVVTCGPSVLTDELETLCNAHGQVTLTYEHFQAKKIDPAQNTEFDLFLRKSNLTTRVKKEESVVEAIRRLGLDVCTSCESGTCGTCETPVASGIPDHRDVMLSDAEKAANKSMMICVSRAKSSSLTLDL